jgi:hypothetical protein
MGRGLVLSPSAAGPPASARTLLALRRGTRAPSLGARVERVYITLLVSAIALAVAWGAIGDAVRNVLQPESWSTWGAPLLLAGVVGALRLGVWQGPVAFAAPDLVHLLASPAPRAGLVRPQLARALAVGAVVAALAAAVGLGGSVAVGEHVAAGWLAAGVAAAAALGALAIAASWLVESQPAAARAVGRAGAAAWLPVVAVAGACGAGGAARTVALASGPWGWAVAVTVAGPGLAGAAFAATLAATAVVVAAAWRRAGAGTLEGFARRAEARAGLIAAGGTGDYRTMALVRRRAAGKGTVGGRGSARLAGPRRPALAIAWRDAVALARDPGRVAAALALGAAAVLAGLAHPDRGAWTVAAAVAGFAAAVLLLEPGRAEADAPDRARVLLGRRPEALLAAHSALPFALLLAAGVLALAAAPLLGVASAAAAAGGLLVTVPAWAVLVLCGAGSAGRGGRIPFALFVLAATDPTGGISVLVWLVAWPIGAAVVVTAALVPAARGGMPLAAAPLLLVAAAALLAFVRRAR